MAPPTTMDHSARTGADDVKPEAQSAGALLRAARERQGMHIATLATAIKVAPRKLEALEQDRWDELPGPTFTRALAQAVCRALKTDPAPVMELLPPADTSMLDSSFGTINEPFSGRGGRDFGLPGWLLPGPWLIAAIALLLAAGLVMWLPAGTWSRLVSARGSATPTATGESSQVIAVPAAQAVPGSTSVANSPQTSPPLVPGSTAPVGSAGAAAISPSVRAATPAAASPSAPAGAAPVPAGALVISCAARSWIEVLDARGRVLVSRNLEAGETLGIDGLAPMQVVVGNSAATQVTYKGAPIDLPPRSRDNVARFELN